MEQLEKGNDLDLVIMSFDDALEKGLLDEVEPEVSAILKRDSVDHAKNSPYKMLVSGFCMGMSQGMDLADVLNHAEKERLTDYTAELSGVASTLRTLMCVIEAEDGAIDMPSNQELHDLLFAQACLIERIKDDIDAL